MKTKLKECIEIYGAQKVITIQQLVEISDPDGVWSLMEDYGDDEAKEIIEILYFND